MKSLEHTASLLFNTPLAVTAERADILASLMAGWMRGEPRAAATAGMPTEATPAPFTVEQGIAVVPIVGTLVKRASWMDAQSGLTSYGDIVAAVDAAANDARVDSILLQIDSPGGQVAGAFEAAAELRAIGKRKRMWAVADSSAFSAAYLLAASAERIFVSETGGLGSIGVIAMRLDATEADAKLGMKWTIVQAGAQKAFGNPHVVPSAEELDDLAAKVADVGDLFAQTIATARHMSARAVAGLEAGTFMGAAAVRAGLADQLGTFNDAFAGLVAAARDQRATRVVAAQGGQRMEATTETKPEIPAPAAAAPNVVPIDKDNPQIKAAIDEAVARATGNVAEVVALCAAFKCPERANGFLADKKTRDEVFAILQAELVAKDQATATSGTHTGEAPAATTTKIDPAAYEALRATAIAEAYARRPAPIVV